MPRVESLSNEKIKEILGENIFKEWTLLINLIESKYDMDQEWHTADKGNAFELKFRRGGKTLTSLFTNFPEENSVGVMIIFGKDERKKFEEQKDEFSKETVSVYDDAKTYRDGKWVMFRAPSKELEKDLISMLAIKRKSNRKLSESEK